MSEEMKTKARFPGWFMEFADGRDDPMKDCEILAEVTDVRDNGEMEIGFTVGKRRLYMDFRQSDLKRAIKEMSE